MTTTQPASTVDNPGAEEALDAIQRNVGHGDFSYLNDWALTFLDLLVPEQHPAREGDYSLGALTEHIQMLAAHRVPNPTDSQQGVEDAIVGGLVRRIKQALDRDPIQVQIITTAAELDAFHAERGLRPDWHEPDEQEIETRTTPGTFDNSSLRPYYLEQSVFFYDTTNADSPVPVAAVNLAALCAFATGYGR